MRWHVDEKLCDNSNVLQCIGDNYILVDKKYIQKLEQNNIEYRPFNAKFLKYSVIRKAKKKKRFNKEQIEEIKKLHYEDKLSYRKLAMMYNCSTDTLNKIFKDLY